MKYYIFTKIIAFLFFTLFSSSLLAASIPNVVNQSPSEEFIGESFCFNADFSNLSADIGYGPYYLLRLDPDLTFQSATFSGLALDLVSNQTYTATGTLNDPISGSAFLGSENGSLVALTIPVGSVSSSQPALSVEICLAVDVNAVPDVLQSDALAVIPGFQFGDSATGVIGSDTIVGSAAVNDFTPTVIQYSVSDTQAETEHPPGPAWTYPITAIADIASTATVTPITFPTVTLPGNVKFTGLPTITGGVNCTLTPDAATLDATTGLGADVDINITCDSGTGTNGNAQDIRVDFDVYIVDTLDNMTCATTGAINTAKHLTLRKSAAGTGRPGSTITYTYAYQTSEFIPGINAFTVTDTLNDGISYSDVGGSFVRLTINHGVTNTTLDVPFVGIGTSASFSNADILTAIINAGGTVDAAESGTISYTTTIDQSYNNGDPVLTRDIITNNVTATYGISGAGNAQNCLETSSASVTIDDITISKSTIGSATVKPGDVVQFQLSMSVPSGDADNVILTDVLPLPVFTATDFPVFSGDLNTYPGSAAAGNFIEYAVGSAEPGNVTISRSAASNSINIDFGDISSATTQTIILNVYAKASAAPYADGLSLANLLNATTNNSAVDNVADNTVTQILVRAPDVTITKEITSVTTNLDAGDEIDYRITIENQGGADAFDVTVTDVFGAALTAGNCTVPVLVGGSGTFTGTLAGGLVLDNTLGAANSGLGEAGSGNEIATLTFTCDINSGIAANTLVENTGQLTFAAGAGEAAFPVRESTVDVNTVTPNVVKTLVTTSESYSNTNELVVGEIARFRIVSTIPEGTHSTVSLSDLLPSQLIYQHDGSASLALVGSSITSSSFADPGGCTYTTTNANIVPDCAITAANAPFVAGDDPSFTLGTVTNSDSDADEELIVLELNAVKVDSGIAGTDFDNQARHTDITGSYDSATLALTRVEPVLTLDKAANNAGGDAGDAITYTLTITAPITTPSTAFDITLTDVLPAALNYVNASAAFGACDAGTTSFDDTDPNGAGISLSIDQLAANESCIFNYDANVSAAATPGQAITNTATLNWTSLDGTGSALSGSTPGTEKSYQAVDSATVTVDVTSSVKSIVSTSLTHTSEAGTGAGGSPRLLSIGEQINYRLLATVPEGSASNFVIRDNLPTGLEYVTASAAIALVSDGNLSSSLAGALCAGGTVAHPDPESSVTPDCAITPTLGASGNSVDFDIGNLTNTDADGDDEFIVIEFSALVKDQLSNQQVVNLSNQFEVLLGGVQNSLSNTMLAQIVEPQLSLTSSTTPNPVDNRTDETPTFAWALTLTNTGLAQAFQIQDGDSGNWQIQLPSGVENITALNVSTAGTVVDNTDLVTAINTAHFSVSGADNNLLSIDRTFAMAPSATLTITFNSTLKASVTPGSTLTTNTDVDYAGQQTGAPAQDVRNFADISTGTGNNPITSTSAPLNNYRTQTAVNVTTTTSTPVIGVAKELVSSTFDATDGSFDLVYRLHVENSGDVALTNIQLTDNLAATFNPIAAVNINVTSVTSADFTTTNGTFDGVVNRELIDNTVPSTLAIGQTKTLDIAVTVSPGTDLGTYNNSVTADGQSARDAGNTATDTSVDGDDPDPASDGPDNDTSVTPVTFAVNPELGLAKALNGPVVNNLNDTYSLNYRFIVKNTGNVDLANVQVIDDLATVFASADSFSVSLPTSGDFAINNAYNGDGDTNLLAANQTLAVGATGMVDLTVTITPGNTLGPYNNSATTTATSPNGNANDTSDNGSDPETNNGSGGFDDATPVTFTEAPAIGIAKAVTTGPINNGDGTHTLTYSMVVKNTGDISLTDVQVVDNLATTFNGATYTIDSTSATNGLTVNGAFDGNGDSNLLAASQNLTVDSSSTITLVVTVTPGNNLGAYNNSATASGSSQNGANANDTSDNGSDPETNNGSGGLNDTTPVTFVEAPAIGIAKAVTTGPSNNGDGTYTLTYSMVVKNTGDSDLTGVQVVDNLATTFNGATYTVDSTSATNGLTVNGAFDGNGDTNLLAASQGLSVGSDSTITLVVTVTPGNNLGAYNNSATASGTSPSGAGVNDTSDNGSDPETNNGSGGLDDATPVTFIEAPAIGAAKLVSSGPVNNGDGSYTLSYDIVVKNTGESDLTNVQVSDDLATTFSGASYAVTAISSADITVNASFNGDGDKNLLSNNQNLIVGARATITVALTVTPGANLGPYNNSATVSGTSPSGATVNDTSDAGSNPESNNGSGGFDDATPVSFNEAPAIGIAKTISAAPVNNNDGSYTLTYSMVVRNNGDIDLNTVQVIEDFAATYPAPASAVVDSLTSSSFTVNNSFNGYDDQNLLAANQTLATGASADLELTLTITPSTFLGPYNNTAKVNATSLSGAVIGDDSDDGIDPNGNNGSGGLNDPTPITFTEAPAIAIAKEISGAVTNNQDGSHSLLYSIVIRNSGDVPLNNVQVVEDLTTTFAGASFTVGTISSADLNVNPSFDGNADNNLLAASQSLAINTSAIILVPVIVTPMSSIGPFNNTAVATGDSPSGASVNDNSDNGDDPLSNNGSGGLNDPTPITFSEAPAIAIAKALLNFTNLGDGRYQIDYQFNSKNTGNIFLSNVQITEDLATIFNDTNSFSVLSLSSADLTVNNSFDGNGDTSLLAANQTLAAANTVTVDLSIIVTPGSDLGPYNNSVNVSATSPSGTSVNDDSDNGLDPETDNGDGGVDDVTPITFTEAPAIGIAKALVAEPINNNDGTYTLSYQLNVENIGDIALNNVQIVEDLSATFPAPATFVVDALSANNLSVNSDFDGVSDTNIFAASQSLAVGASDTITLTLTVTPGANLGPYNNSATASGTSPSGADVSDDSDNGSNTSGDNSEGTEDDPTPVTFTEAPAIAVAKAITNVTNNGDGTYTLGYQFNLKNTGDIALSNVQVSDNLFSTFQNQNIYTIVSLTSANLVVNNNFDGNADSNLLAANQNLAVSATDVIDLVLTITPAGNLGPYDNSAQASGTSPSGASVNDDSDNGLNPESDNGDGGVDDVTPITFTEAPAIGIAKALVAEPINNNDGTYTLSYQLNVENIGDIALSNVQVVEDLSATFPAPTTFTVNALSANSLTINSDFDGVSDSNIFAASQSLAVGASDTITLTLTVTPGANLGPYNNTATASGTSPSGADVSDDSDNGSNTSGDNGEGTEEDPTPVTFTEAPAIGVAKTVSGDIAPTTNGTAGNFDVPFALMIENIGDVPLTNIQLVDDLASQFGDAYVGLSEAATITASTAQETPQLSPDFPANLFDGESGRLMPGENINISFTLELNPSSDDAKGLLTNQAQALGTSTGGQVVDDLSDSGANASDNADTGGDNPDAPGNTAGGTDDPTPFELPAGSLQGVVWLDGDRNDELNDGETLLIGWTVQVTDANGNVIATVLTDENGFFLVDNLPQGEYTVTFITPTGTTFTSKTVLVPANESVNIPVPVDPSGVVYDSITRIPVANSLVSILDENGVALPDVCLLPNQQHQITGDDGFYFFLLLLDADPACASGASFTLAVTAPEEQYQPSHSRLILPQDGALDPTGQPSPFALSHLATAPQIGDDTTYYMAFTLANGDPDVINNHIPVDQIGVNPHMIRLTKRADSKQTLIGGLVRYTVQVENISEVDVNNLTLVDQLPAGFSYVKNSIYTNDTDGQLQLNSVNPLSVSGIDVPAQESVDLVYILRVGAGVARGKHINRVSPFLGDAPIGNEATASVIVGADPDFEEVTILGKVFDDRDQDNWQDSANASAVFIQGGINAQHYIANSTRVIDSNGKGIISDASDDANNGAPLNRGIALGDLLGLSSVADHPHNHQIIVRQQLRELAFTDDLLLTTTEGSHISMNRHSEIQLNHQGEMQQGLNAQNLTIERTVTLLANGNYQVDLIIQNNGIQEIGIPGVRVATLDGIYVETDLHGRFHLEAVDVVNLARGRNFYMKVDQATLPPQSEFVSENPRVKRIAQGLPTRFDFAVQLAPEQLGGEEKHAVVKLGELLFNDNSATINSEHRTWLTQMADTINQYQGGQVQIIGQAHQQALAYERANNTYQALLPLIREDLRHAFSVDLMEEIDGAFAPMISLANVTKLGKVLFDTDKTTIKAQYAPLLDSIATQLVAAETGHLAITGFADSRASQDYNLALGLRRAKAVFGELKKRMPIAVWETLTIKIQKIDAETNTEVNNPKDANTEGK